MKSDNPCRELREGVRDLCKQFPDEYHRKIYAYTNILAALLRRSTTGEGAHIDVSMLEALTEWMGFPLCYAFEGAAPPPRAGASHASIYPYGPFPFGDGGTVMRGLQNEREWKLFCQIVLENEALATDPRFDSNSRRSANPRDLDAIIAQAFAPLARADVLERLERAGIANASVNEMKDLWAHPQLKGRDRWRAIGSPSGEIPALLPPGRSDAAIGGSRAWTPFHRLVSPRRRSCVNLIWRMPPLLP